MNPTEEIILRKYLKRKIAIKNNSFNGMTSQFKDAAKLLRNNIFTVFARGEAGTYAATSSNLNLIDVRDHIERTGNRMSPYNYFDLDTLIAYDAFLEQILSDADIIRMKDMKMSYKSTDFDTAINYTARKYLIQNAGKFETGYYNLKCPIKILRDERRTPMPERTPDGKAFEAKYSVSYCERLLNQYLDEKHPNENVRNTYAMEQFRDTYDFLYKNVQYVIDSEEDYLGDESSPITYVIAHSVDGKYHLRGYFDSCMNEYVGDIYNMDNHYLYPSEDSGIDVYDNHPDKSR